MSSLFTTSAATSVPAPNKRSGGVSNKWGNFGVNYGKRHSQAAEMEVSTHLFKSNYKFLYKNAD